MVHGKHIRTPYSACIGRAFGLDLRTAPQVEASLGVVSEAAADVTTGHLGVQGMWFSKIQGLLCGAYRGPPKPRSVEHVFFRAKPDSLCFADCPFHMLESIVEYGLRTSPHWRLRFIMETATNLQLVAANVVVNCPIFTCDKAVGLKRPQTTWFWNSKTSF